jgi:hypothetical protein
VHAEKQSARSPSSLPQPGRTALRCLARRALRRAAVVAGGPAAERSASRPDVARRTAPSSAARPPPALAISCSASTTLALRGRTLGLKIAPLDPRCHSWGTLLRLHHARAARAYPSVDGCALFAAHRRCLLLGPLQRMHRACAAVGVHERELAACNNVSGADTLIEHASTTCCAAPSTTRAREGLAESLQHN